MCTGIGSKPRSFSVIGKEVSWVILPAAYHNLLALETIEGLTSCPAYGLLLNY